MKEMPERIYLFDCNEAMTTPLEGDTEYIRKDIMDELIKTAEDRVAIAAAKTYLQENPVTPVWHDASEKPADAINTLVMTGEGHFVVAAYFYKKSIIGKDMWMWADGFPVGEAENGNTIYSSWCELNENDIVKWAYVDDLLKVTHSVIKISDQEPKTEYVLYGVDGRNPQEDKDTNPFDVEVERWRKEKGADNIRYYECARHFAEWQKQQLMKDVVEAEYWDGSLFKNELRERFKDGDKVKLIIIKENEKVIKS